MKNRLHIARGYYKISQARLAKRIKVSRYTVSAIETNKHIPSTALALRIAHFFGLKVEDIFYLEEDRQDTL